MSKKRKRQVQSDRPVEVKPITPLTPSSRSTVEAFNPDYTYVKKDLRRIGILASSFLAVLFILSFFLG